MSAPTSTADFWCSLAGSRQHPHNNSLTAQHSASPACELEPAHGLRGPTHPGRRDGDSAQTSAASLSEPSGGCSRRSTTTNHSRSNTATGGGTGGQCMMHDGTGAPCSGSAGRRRCRHPWARARRPWRRKTGGLRLRLSVRRTPPRDRSPPCLQRAGCLCLRVLDWWKDWGRAEPRAKSVECLQLEE